MFESRVKEGEFFVLWLSVVITDSCSSNEHPCTQQRADHATKAKCELKQAKKNMHPGFAIAFDNIDGKRACRHITKDNQNLDFHWVSHKIIMNRVSGGCLETLTRDITSLSNLKLFPTVDDQKFQRHNYTVLVSRVLVEHLDSFSALKDVCVFHIPHKHSNEMAKKSEVVSYSFFLWVLSCCFLLLYWFSKFSPLISAFNSIFSCIMNEAIQF